jgi:ribosome-associated toxin RatA of RatAB toxin-antitoxin module
MGSISKSAVVPYTAEQMYSLVNDIEAYPEFLPWCTEATVYNRTDTGLRASVSLATGKIKQSFTTENTMRPGSLIDVRLISGPFSYLNGNWRFENVGNNLCRIDLQMEFEFRNKLLKLALGAVFTQFMSRLVSSFVDRAEQIHGKQRVC